MGKRLRIGLYLNNLDEAYQISVYKAVRAEARTLGMDLVCVQGETLNRSAELSLTTFPSRKFMDFDGVLLLSSVLIDRIDDVFLPDIRNQFNDIPCVSIGNRLLDYPSIIIKTRSSMERLMEHLIVEHGYRKLLYIGGPANHRDNSVREHVFRRSINTYKLTYPEIESDVKNGGFNESSGSSIMREYIATHSGDSIDAIVVANDNMALGAIHELKDAKDARWHTCAITGFDDIPQAQIEVPALTTVRQPLESLGRESVRTLKSLIEGKSIAPIINIDTELVIRNSCGCAGQKAQTVQSGENAAYLRKKLEQVQYQTAKTEQYLRNISYFGQYLITIDSLFELIRSLSDFLSGLEIKTFFMIVFPEQEKTIPDEGHLLFRKTEEVEESWPYMDKKIVLKDFFNEPVCGDNPRERILYHLCSGSEILGLIYYEAQDFAQPLVCSSAAFLSNTLKRLKLLEDEKERARNLEHEVAVRTRDLLETNKKLKQEAVRRIEVEAEVLRISEMERLRFSLDLHDDICQRLAGISMYCKGLSVIPDVADMIDETLHLTRQYAQDSFPMELDTLGLQDALQSLCHAIEKNTRITCNFSWLTAEKSPLSRPQEINVYRIIQEALQNVIKHSKATMADITISRERGFFTVKVSDNGIGAPHPGDMPYDHLQEAAAPKKRREGLGLRSMQYRAHQLGAEYIFRSSKNEGTTIILKIPLGNENEFLKGEL